VLKRQRTAGSQGRNRSRHILPGSPTSAS